MSTLSATSNDSLFESPFGYSANEAEINSWQLATIPSILRFTNIDIFGSAKDQLRNGNNKPYSPFNDYFGLAGKIKSFGNAIDALGEKDQVHPIHRMEESDILRLKSTWQSNSIHHNMKQTLDRDCVFRLDEGVIGYVEPLSNGIWNNNNNDTDSSTHTSPLTPSQTFSSFTHLERDMRLNASIQHHVVSMLQAEELMRINSKQHAIGHTGSIGDEDSLSEGSSNGICSGRGIMSSAVSAAIVNAVSNMNGSDDGKLQRHRRVKLCVFCRNNGEPDTVYKTHILKDQSGKVTCPVLRAYTCPTCGASGDDAHTLKYCPATQPTIIYSPGIPDNGVKW